MAKNGELAWYIVDDATLMTAKADGLIGAQIQQLKSAKLPPAVLAAAISALQDKANNGKTFKIGRARSTQGKADLVELRGAFKSKMISSNVLRGIIDNVELCKEFLSKHWTEASHGEE